MRRLDTLLALLSAIFCCTHAAAQESVPGMPTSGGYKPPALSLESLMTETSELGRAMMAAAATGDFSSFSKFVQSQAANGDIGAELLLGEQYIPEQCTFEPDRDAPHCGKDGNETPHVVFRANPLGIPASYEEAAHWLERASTQGCGEASEVLAQLITRMLANGHATTYTVADSARLHALARSQGFDVESISVTCYQLTPGSIPLSLGKQPKGLLLGQPPPTPLSEDQLNAIRALHPTGTLRFQGFSGTGDSTLLTRPEGPPVQVYIILDHDPGHEVHLAIPAHHDRIYVQNGDAFVSIPPDESNLPRYFSIMPQRPDYKQVSIFIQQMSGGFSGGCSAQF